MSGTAKEQNSIPSQEAKYRIKGCVSCAFFNVLIS